MKPYTFYLYDGQHPQPHFDFAQCESNDAALEHARAMLKLFPEYASVEVFDGGAWRSTLVRRAAQRAADPEPIHRLAS
jgi:hypothetical protein